MNACKGLARSSLSCLEHKFRTKNLSPLSLQPHFPSPSGFKLKPYSRAHSRPYSRTQAALSLDPTANPTCSDETLPQDFPPEPVQEECDDTVEELLLNEDDASKLMKMERRPEFDPADPLTRPRRWFPYIDRYNTGTAILNSDQVLEALDPHIMDARKDKFKKLVKNRSYSVCLVVEGLSDFGNVSAVFRSADALGFQSVHVISRDSTKRFNQL